jgi:hypothetical protein
LLAISPYRGLEGCERIREQFSAAFARHLELRDSGVHRALASGRFDILTLKDAPGGGFGIADYPRLLESWMDEFYLECLRSDGATESHRS